MAEPGLKLETIQRALNFATRIEDALAGVYACKVWGQGPRTEADWQMVEDWAKDSSPNYKAAALCAYGPTWAPKELVLEGLRSDYRPFRFAALYAGQGKKFRKELVEKLALEHWFNLAILGDLPEKMSISVATIGKWIGYVDPVKKYLAVRACQNKDVPLEWLFDALGSDYADVSIDENKVAMEVLRAKNVPVEILKQYWDERGLLQIVGICAGRNDAVDIIRDAIDSWDDGMEEGSWWVRKIGRFVVAKACQGVDFSLSEIDKWRNSESIVKREAAMYASIGRFDVPNEWVAKALDDESAHVRGVARLAREGRNFPPIRDFEPSRLVYKACLNDVIVTASIPKDAEIRGSWDTFGKRLRTNKAVIVDVEGDFYGEKVGISGHDKETLYRVGDELFMPNFDLSEKEPSTGFHFFTSRFGALKYKVY